MGDVVALVTDVVRLCKIIAARAQEAKEHKAICDALAGYLGCIEPIHDAVLGLPELADKRHIALSLAQLKKQLERAEELVQSCSQKSMLSLFVFSKKQELKDVEGAIQLYVGTLTAALAISIKYASHPESGAGPSQTPDPHTNTLVSSGQLSAKLMVIVWGDDTRYWEWARRKGSRFEEVAHLKMVCWLGAHGTMSCNLEAGTYTLSWRLHVEHTDLRRSHGWAEKPVIFGFKTSDGQTQERAQNMMLSKHEPNCRHTGNGWRELDVGEFSVPPHVASACPKEQQGIN